MMQSKKKIKNVLEKLTAIWFECCDLELEALCSGLNGKAAGFADVREKCWDAINHNKHLFRKD